MSWIAAVGVAALVLGSACHRGAAQEQGVLPASPPSGQAADTARGIVAVVGSERSEQVVLKQAPMTRSITLTGALEPVLMHTSGADVWVTGTRTGNTLEVRAFVVRTVDGNSAIDGRVVVEGDRFYLVTADSVRHLIARPPPMLHTHIGARVWITGPLDGDPIAFGVIDGAR